jgi:hypothetical protein
MARGKMSITPHEQVSCGVSPFELELGLKPLGANGFGLYFYGGFIFVYILIFLNVRRQYI